VTSEIAFIDTYACPRCGTELETPPGYGSMWLLCPRCGRAGLPPESSATAVRPVRPAAYEPGVLVIGPADNEPLAPARTKRPLSVWRVVLLTALLIALFALVGALVEQQTFVAAISGFATLVFLGLLTYPTKPGRD